MTEKKILKAYENQEFLQSKEGRLLRIMSEFVEPKARLEAQHISDTIVFFGSARAKSIIDAKQDLEDIKNSGDATQIAEAEQQVKLASYYEQARELSLKLTEWSKDLEKQRKRFVICTGGGPGMMEAANRGASEGRGMNMGFNISLPFEQYQNPWVTKSLSFEFHYFFMRKFWFAYLAKAIIIFPGGFGTLDELFEVLTLIQTRKMEKHVPIVLFGREFWDEIVNFDALVKWGVISKEDINLFYQTDDVDDAFQYLTKELLEYGLAKPGDGLK